MGEPGPIPWHVTPDWWALRQQERWVAHRHPAWPGTVWLRLEIQNGRTVTTGLLVETREPLTLEMVRRVPMGRLLEFDAAGAADEVLRIATATSEQVGPNAAAPLDPAGEPTELPLTAEDFARPLDEALADWIGSGHFVPALPKETTRKRPGRRGHDDEFYRYVARVWRVALRDHPRAPMQWTADELDRSVAQARRLVRRAEDRGFLEEDIET